MRALGRKWKVLIVMFTKGGDNYGELKSFKNLSDEISNNLTIVQAGLTELFMPTTKAQMMKKRLSRVGK